MAVEYEVKHTHSGNLSFREAVLKIREAFKYLLRKWLVIAGIGFLGGCLGVAYAYFKPAQYAARITFSLEEGLGSSVGAAASLAAQFGFDIGGMGQSAFTGDNILQIIVTRRMIERTLFTLDSANGKKQTLLDYYLGHEDLGQDLLEYKRFRGIAVPKQNLGSERFTYLQDSLLFAVYDRISKRHLAAFKPDKKLSIYELDITSPDEYFSKVFAQRLLSETSSFYGELKTEKSMETLRILERRVDSLNRALNRSISRKAGAQDANLNPAMTSVQVPAQLQQVNISIYSAAYSELFKNLELIRFQAQKEKPLFQVIEDVRYPLKRIKNGRLRTGLAFAFAASLIAVLSLLGSAFVKEKMK